ncbi:hypothetical protein ACM66B_000955 [Microbotryomycetes sp. NB124-2]
MPGLRFYTEIKLGTAFGARWRKQFRQGSSKDARGAASQSTLSLAKSLGSGPSLVSLVRGRANSSAQVNDDDDDADSDDGGVEDGITYMSRDQRRAWRIIRELQSSEEWRGTKYNLLQRNCNTFTQELVYRLTGQHAPAWINRAAWVATSVPCIVPAGWVDDVEEVAPDAPPDGSLALDTPSAARSPRVTRTGPSPSEPMRL